MSKSRGMGRVYQAVYRSRHGELKSCATWRIEYYVNGRRFNEKVESTNRADAVRLLKSRLGDAAAGKPVGPQLERTTFDDLLELVQDDYKANTRASLDRVRQAAKHLREFFRGNRRAREITSDLVTRYAVHRLEDDAKASTINYELAVARRGFRLGLRAGKVGARPEITMLRVDNTRQGFFEADEFQGVLGHLPYYLKPVAIIAYITGWRTQSELLTRQWRHVDLAAGWLRLDTGEGKTRQGRMFPFSPQLRTTFDAQREYVHQVERRIGAVIPWVFIRPDGCQVRDFRFAWAKACRAAGVPGRLVHDMRRTAVRNLERAGVPRSTAMKLTGHETEAIYRRYAIVDSGMLQEGVGKLAVLHAAETRLGENPNSFPTVGTMNGSSR